MMKSLQRDPMNSASCYIFPPWRGFFFLKSFLPGGKETTLGGLFYFSELPRAEGGGGRHLFLFPAHTRPYPRASDGQDLRTSVQRDEVGREG